MTKAFFGSLALCAFLASCGGGDSGVSSNSGSSTLAAGTTTAPASNFTATLTSAPADGTYICSMATLEVRGSGLRNVELLPPTGYSPKLGTFTVSADGKIARMQFDPGRFPNGEIRARISAFNAPAGQPAQEIVVMPERTWRIANDTPPCLSPGSSGQTPDPNAPFSATLTQAPADGTYVCSMTTIEVQGNRLRNVELLPPNSYTPKLGTFTVSANGRLARMDFDPRQWPNGDLHVRISAFDAPAGQAANEIVLTQDRIWRIANDTWPCMSPGSTTAGR